MGARPALRALAERAGILPSYTPSGGGTPVATPDRTREALLAAMGLDARDEAAAERSLAALSTEERAQSRERRRRAAQRPQRCVAPEEVLGARRAYGLWANLYTLRGSGRYGVGTLADLRALVRFAGAHGAAFVGISPLHAVRNRPPEVSPYTPLSRLFHNPLYIDVDAVPELEESPEARRVLDAQEPQSRALRESGRIDYERAAALQREALAALYEAFAKRHRDRPTPRGRDFDAFCARGGDLLRDFATFQALEDHFAAQGRARDWRAWPAEYRDPRSPAVREHRERHAEAVDLHIYAQLELDRQLARAAAEAQEAGAALGLYQDLALGSVASGFDAWAFGDLFVGGVTLGAPPDAYADQGQDWGLPPLCPRRLAASDYDYFARLLRAGFRHGGALRIDHALGLQRQWWVPDGFAPAEGAYVRFPLAELLRVVAEESRRHGAVVIGEDLGTVPRGLPAALARAGVLSSRVMIFERDRRGRFRPASRYSSRALVTASTHDLPPLAAFFSGRDLEMRREAGAIPDDAALAAERRRRDAECRALLRRLAADGALPSAEAPASFPELCAAVNRFLCGTPAPLVGVSLDDLAGETEPVNLPGVGPDRHPSWTRRMRRSLSELASDPGVERALEGAASRALPR